MSWKDPKDRALRMIRKKGWSVKVHGPDKKFCAYTILGTVEGKQQYLYHGCSSDYRDAVVMAIVGAIKDRKIDWSKTRLWLETAKMDVTNTDLELRLKMTVYGAGRYGRGWSVQNVTTKGRLRNDLWQARVGKHAREGKLIKSSASKTVAVRSAIMAAKETPHYGEQETIVWLMREGMEDLIPVAKVKRRACA